MKDSLNENAWPVFAALSWGMVMWLFRWYPEVLQPSLKSSMKYMYVAQIALLPLADWGVLERRC